MSVARVQKLSWIAVVLACAGAVCNSFTVMWPVMQWVMVGFDIVAMILVTVGLLYMNALWKKPFDELCRDYQKDYGCERESEQ